jgi:hypothetical protein
LPRTFEVGKISRPSLKCANGGHSDAMAEVGWTQVSSQVEHPSEGMGETWFRSVWLRLIAKGSQCEARLMRGALELSAAALRWRSASNTVRLTEFNAHAQTRSSLSKYSTRCMKRRHACGRCVCARLKIGSTRRGTVLKRLSSAPMRCFFLLTISRAWFVVTQEHLASTRAQSAVIDVVRKCVASHQIVPI